MGYISCLSKDLALIFGRVERGQIAGFPFIVFLQKGCSGVFGGSYGCVGIIVTISEQKKLLDASDRIFPLQLLKTTKNHPIKILYKKGYIAITGAFKILALPKKGGMGRGGRCSFLLTMRCFNNAMFWNS